MTRPPSTWPRLVGFEPVGTDTGYANARGTEIDEVILRLDPR